jgi:amino acid transporter
VSAPRQGLRRELHFWEAIALSIAIMAPTAAMALNGVGIAGLIGRAVPLAFLFALVGVLLVAWGVAQLTREVSHAGSVYALTGFALGARAGFLAGWALLGTYLCFTVASSAEVGLFFSSFLASTGIADNADWIWIALVSAALIALIAGGDIRVATRSLLTLEGISVTLIVILVVVIFVRLIVGSAPEGHSASLGDAFDLPSGTSLDAIATASVFGFLSFAGFEGAAALGEETDQPRRNIPRAVFLAPLSMGVFYFFVILSQTLGFGTDEAGVAAFAGSSSPLGELSKSYVSGHDRRPVADGGLHRGQPRRDPPSVPPHGAAAAVADRLPRARHRVPAPHDLQERQGHSGPVQPFPVVRARLARRRRPRAGAGSACGEADRRTAHQRDRAELAQDVVPAQRFSRRHRG